MCKCLVFWMKKTKAWPKKSHFLKLPFSLVIFSDKNHRAKFAVTWTCLIDQQIVQSYSSKHSFSGFGHPVTNGNQIYSIFEHLLLC